MGNFLFTITLGTILYFLYGSLVFWSVGSALAVLFIALMFIDIKDTQEKIEKQSNKLLYRLDKALF